MLPAQHPIKIKQVTYPGFSGITNPCLTVVILVSFLLLSIAALGFWFLGAAAFYPDYPLGYEMGVIGIGVHLLIDLGLVIFAIRHVCSRR